MTTNDCSVETRVRPPGLTTYDLPVIRARRRHRESHLFLGHELFGPCGDLAREFLASRDIQRCRKLRMTAETGERGFDYQLIEVFENITPRLLLAAPPGSDGR